MLYQSFGLQENLFEEGAAYETIEKAFIKPYGVSNHPEDLFLLLSLLVWIDHVSPDIFLTYV